MSYPHGNAGSRHRQRCCKAVHVYGTLNMDVREDRENTLQDINKWIGGGEQLNLVKTVDTDILRHMVIKLQKRVQSKTATLLIT